MTCVIGFVDKETGSAYLACDSSSSNGHTYNTLDTSKVFKKNDHDGKPMLFGYTSSFRFGQIIEHHVTLPPREGDKQKDLHYLVQNVIPQIRKALKDHGFTTINNNLETGGFCLVAYEGNLYKIQNDFSVLKFDCSFASVGSGEDKATAIFNFIAGGFLPNEMSVAYMLEAILEAVSMSDCFVKPPFKIFKT